MYDTVKIGGLFKRSPNGEHGEKRMMLVALGLATVSSTYPRHKLVCEFETCGDPLRGCAPKRGLLSRAVNQGPRGELCNSRLVV